MRWDEQRVGEEAERPLPGLAVDAVRTFDAPEALGIRFHEVRAKSALNHVPGSRFGFNWTINLFRGCAHACSYCFARPTHRYLDLDAGRDFEREIVVKVNLPEVLSAELRRRSWKRELVAIGTNTDPYQWVEGRYKLMPPVLDALHEAGTPVSILTKSPLVLRDIDRYVEMAAGAGATVNLSIPTLDEKAWRATEPHTPHPRARLEAVAELNRRGVDSGILVMPLMPGINDDPEQVDELVGLAREAGATFVASTGLHLRGEVRDVFFGWLAEKRPDLIPRYEKLYQRSAYLPKTESARLNSLVKGWGRNRRRSSAGGAGSAVSGPRAPGSTAGKRAPRDRTRRRAAQGSLF